MDGINLLPEACVAAGEAAISLSLTGRNRYSYIGKKRRMDEVVALVKNTARHFHISHLTSKNPLRHDRQAALPKS